MTSLLCRSFYVFQQVNGMCKPTYSCTLNEGKSFEAAFVIAHEMAHR